MYNKKNNKENYMKNNKNKIIVLKLLGMINYMINQLQQHLMLIEQQSVCWKYSFNYKNKKIN